jgi:hypothetical protein
MAHLLNVAGERLHQPLLLTVARVQLVARVERCLNSELRLGDGACAVFLLRLLLSQLGFRACDLFLLSAGCAVSTLMTAKQ